jgi:hypothetical protein
LSKLVGRPLERPIDTVVSEEPAGRFSDATLKRGGFAASDGGFFRPSDSADVRAFQAREALTERIAGLADDYPDPEQRIWPFALAFSEFVPHLDPDRDADLIAMGNAVMAKALDRD